MALIARPHLPNSTPSATLVAAGLFVAAAALATALSTVHIPSSATQGLPVDWAQRSAWLVVQGLIGLGIALVVVTVVLRRERSG